MTEPENKAKRAGLRIGRLIGWKYSGNIAAAAEALDEPYTKVYKIARGIYVPDAEFLAHAANHFEVTLDALMADDEEPGRRRARRT